VGSVCKKINKINANEHEDIQKPFGEIIELFSDTASSGQWRMLDSLYKNGYQQAPSNLKEILKQMIVN
jgi:hypothetical protein